MGGGGRTVGLEHVVVVSVQAVYLTLRDQTSSVTLLGPVSLPAVATTTGAERSTEAG